MCMPTTPATAPPIYSVEPYMYFRGQYLSNRVSASLINMMLIASLACGSNQHPYKNSRGSVLPPQPGCVPFEHRRSACFCISEYTTDRALSPVQFRLIGIAWLQVVLRRTAIIEATIGAPGLSIPIGLADDKMPVGFQLQSRPGRHLLSIFPHCACFALKNAWGAMSADMAFKQSIPGYPGCCTQQLGNM